MKKFIILLPAVALVAIGLSWNLYAPDEPRTPEQLAAAAAELEKKAEILAGHGKRDAVEATIAKARALLKQAEKAKPRREREEDRRDRPRADRDRSREGDRERDRDRDREHREDDRSRDRENGDEDHGDADERELRVWVQQQEQRIRKLRDEGKNEAALELIKRVRQVIAEHRNHGDDRRERDRERGHGERDQERDEGKRREHIAAAIEHLHAAGMHELAEKLEAELKGHRERERRDGHTREHRPNEVENLRREVNELRNMIREIHQHLRDRRERD